MPDSGSETFQRTVVGPAYQPFAPCLPTMSKVISGGVPSTASAADAVSRAAAQRDEEPDRAPHAGSLRSSATVTASELPPRSSRHAARATSGSEPAAAAVGRLGMKRGHKREPYQRPLLDLARGARSWRRDDPGRFRAAAAAVEQSLRRDVRARRRRRHAPGVTATGARTVARGARAGGDAARGGGGSLRLRRAGRGRDRRRGVGSRSTRRRSRHAYSQHAGANHRRPRERSKHAPQQRS